MTPLWLAAGEGNVKSAANATAPHPKTDVFIRDAPMTPTLPGMPCLWQRRADAEKPLTMYARKSIVAADGRIPVTRRSGLRRPSAPRRARADPGLPGP